MFWAVGVGISNGVGYFQVSIISSVFIGLVMLGAKSIPTKARAQLLVVKLDGSYKTILDSTLSDLTKYNMSSLYFDSIDDTDLKEKLDGILLREKYRIRIYDYQDEIIKFEVKRKTTALFPKSR